MLGHSEAHNFLNVVSRCYSVITMGISARNLLWSQLLTKGFNRLRSNMSWILLQFYTVLRRPGNLLSSQAHCRGRTHSQTSPSLAPPTQELWILPLIIFSPFQTLWSLPLITFSDIENERDKRLHLYTAGTERPHHGAHLWFSLGDLKQQQVQVETTFSPSGFHSTVNHGESTSMYSDDRVEGYATCQKAISLIT